MALSMMSGLTLGSKDQGIFTQLNLYARGPQWGNYYAHRGIWQSETFSVVSSEGRGC